MNNEERHTDPAWSDTDETTPGGGLLVGIVIAVSVILAAVLAFSLIGREETVVAPETATTLPEPLVAPSAEPAVIPVPERIDPELTAWNEDRGPAIARLLSLLAAPPVRDVTLLRFRCKQMLEPLADLETGTKPGKAEVAEAFDLWLLSVRDAITFCLEGSQELPVDEALPIAGSTLGSTSTFWEGFLRELVKYVDLSGKPLGVEPNLP
jgi:hypothetical protein